LVNRFFHRNRFYIEWWDYFGKEGQLQNKKRIYRLLLGRWEIHTEISSKKRADGVIVLSELMYKRAITNGINENKIKIIHGGADINNLRFLPYGTNKSRLGISQDVLTIGFIGDGDSEINDMSPFFYALKALSCRNVCLRFINYGRPFTCAVRDGLIDEKIIIEAGWINYATNSSLLSASDVFVIIKQNNVTNNYGWPTKVGDYLALGRPIITTPYGDWAKEIVKYDIQIIPVRYDSNSIEKVLLNIENGKYDLYGMGYKNRIVAEKYLSWRLKAIQLNDFYKQNTKYNL
jgi:glycosyltransferase involved in cell wall biosynthesis